VCAGLKMLTVTVLSSILKQKVRGIILKKKVKSKLAHDSSKKKYIDLTSHQVSLFPKDNALFEK
jgi:hypothetical protein